MFIHAHRQNRDISKGGGGYCSSTIPGPKILINKKKKGNLAKSRGAWDPPPYHFGAPGAFSPKHIMFEEWLVQCADAPTRQAGAVTVGEF